MIFDPLYFIIAAPGMLLALYASWAVKSKFAKYSKVAASSRLSGAQAARRMLDVNGLQEVAIEQVDGFLSDHYDPAHRVLRLSPQVYQSHSLSAVGVACHEAGHALQHAQHYLPLKLRSAMVPVTLTGSKLSMPVLMVGALLSGVSPQTGHSLIMAGVILFSASVLFSLVTLPVEWDASARAKREMVTAGIVTNREQDASAEVLNAAFLTYLAAAISSLLTLLYYLWRLGIIGGGRRD